MARPPGVVALWLYNDRLATQTQIQTIRLSQLTGKITTVIHQQFMSQTYWVIADISNYTFYPSKDYHYFDLVEKEEGGHAIIAKMQAVAWKNGSIRIKHFEKVAGQKFKAGIKVSVKVEVSHHAAYGLKLVVLDVDPAYTIGQLELQRQATIQQLLNDCSGFIQRSGDGFITHNNRLSHAMVIQKIAVLSSSASAGLQDFMKTLLQNNHGYRFLINNYYIAVQGEAHAAGAGLKIKEIEQAQLQYDVVVLIRGGGADTDFLLFDQYALCEAIARCRIPVITGIGHTKNMTLADQLAHTATHTPTKVAEYILAHNHRFDNALAATQKRLVIKAQQVVGKHQQAIAYQHSKLTQRSRKIISSYKDQQQKIKAQITCNCQQRFYGVKTNLRTSANKVTNWAPRLLQERKNQLKQQATQLPIFLAGFFKTQAHGVERFEWACRVMSPVNLLKKGFALLYHHNEIVSDSTALQEGDAIQVRLLESEVTAIVQHKTPKDGNTYIL